MALISPEWGEINRGTQLLFKHKEIAGTPYTPPNPEHYPHGYLWDSGFHAIVYARSRFPDAACKELEAVFSWREENGFIPNMRFANARKRDPERLFVFGKDAVSSKYSQPPVLAWAAWETYTAFITGGQKEKGRVFLAGIFNPLKSFFQYFIDERQNDSNSLIKVVHPHETGRDSDPTFDFVKRWRIPRNKTPALAKPIVDKLNTATNYVSTISFGIKVKNNNWNPDIFGVNDVMFNAIYAQGLSYMCEISKVLGDYERASFYENRSRKVGSDIVQQMWDDKDQMFYAQRNGAFLKTISISNLAPVMLSEIEPFQYERLLELMENPEWFGTPYPLPSVPINSVHFNPTLSEWSIWRGGTWVPSNVLIEKGIRDRAEQFREKYPRLSERGLLEADTIRKRTKEMVNKSGLRECYNPFTAEGLRQEVKTFGMSALAEVM